MMYAGILIAVVADILIFRALIDYSTARHNKLRLAELEYEQKLSQNYYDSIRKNAEQLMKYKHDFNNIVSTAYSLLSSSDPEQRERGMQILGELYQKNLKNPIIPHYCANSTINAVIFDKMNAADERGVELITNINIPENMKVELTDLCSVFANLIDNAIASAEKSKNNRVELSAHTDIGCLFVLAKKLSRRNAANACEKSRTSRTANFPSTVMVLILSAELQRNTTAVLKCARRTAALRYWRYSK